MYLSWGINSWMTYSSGTISPSAMYWSSSSLVWIFLKPAEPLPFLGLAARGKETLERKSSMVSSSILVMGQGMPFFMQAVMVCCLS